MFSGRLAGTVGSSEVKNGFDSLQVSGSCGHLVRENENPGWKI